MKFSSDTKKYTLILFSIFSMLLLGITGYLLIENKDIYERQQHISELNQQIARLTVQLGDLRGKLSQHVKDVSEQQALLEVAQKNYGYIQGEFSRLKREKDAAYDDMTRILREKESLEYSKSLKVKEYEQLKSDSGVLVDKMAYDALRLDQMTKQLAALESKKSEVIAFDKLINDLKSKESELLTTISGLSSKKVQIVHFNEDADKQFSTLKVHIEKYKNEICELDNKCNQLKNNYDSLEKIHRDLKTNNHDLQVCHQELSVSLEMLKQKEELLEYSKKLKTKEYEQLKSDAELMTNKIAHDALLVDRMTKQLSVLAGKKAEATAFDKIINDLKAEESELLATIAGLLSKKAQIVHFNEDAEDQISNLKAHAEKHKNAIRELDDKCNQLKIQCDALKKIQRDLKTQNNDLQAYNQGLNVSQEILKQKKASLEKDIQELDQLLKTIEARVNQHKLTLNQQLSSGANFTGNVQGLESFHKTVMAEELGQ